MTKLTTSPNLEAADDFYARLLALHEGKSAEESACLNAKLILLLANQIGDADILAEALRKAGEDQ